MRQTLAKRQRNLDASFATMSLIFWIRPGLLASNPHLHRMLPAGGFTPVHHTGRAVRL
jgi:hypothetical protein